MLTPAEMHMVGRKQDADTDDDTEDYKSSFDEDDFGDDDNSDS
jgi:hypothetical protein